MTDSDPPPERYPSQKESVMDEPLNGCELTEEARQAIALLRHGPQSLQGLAETLGLNLEQTQAVFQRLSRHVGIVPLFRSDTLRYGLAEETQPLNEYYS
jgi:hypothetical protein